MNRWGEYVTIFYPEVWVSDERIQKTHRTKSLHVSMAGEDIFISICLAMDEHTRDPSGRRSRPSGFARINTLSYPPHGPGEMGIGASSEPMGKQKRTQHVCARQG